VAVEETKSPEEPAEAELADPMVVESEETYLQDFDTDDSHQDTAMKGAEDDWLQMPAEKQKKHDKTKFVVDQAYKYVKMKKDSYVRAHRSEALQSQRNYKNEKARREKRDMPRTPPPPRRWRRASLDLASRSCG
jgi:hypothetical protein